MSWLGVLPTWCWWLLALALAGGGQQLRVIGLQGELATERSAARDAGERLAACRETRGNLLVQVGEQNQALAGLRLAAAERQARAAKAQTDAQGRAEAKYQAANRVQQERMDGDACAAAESVIDRELGL